MSGALDVVVYYHQATKHDFYAYARGPGYLDWDTQPDPFRRYLGAPLVKLQKVKPEEHPLYEPSFLVGNNPPVPLNFKSVSQLLFNSLAISAWKRVGDVTWSLRVNPSSGNLHPTEGYVICGPVEGLSDTPMVCHYAPKEHALELRALFSPETWRALTARLPPNTLLIGLTSIHWREAWKYGERAFRYCQHDAGHAMAALSIAAAGLGWQATLLDDLGTGELSYLIGVFDQRGPEAERPDCLLAVYPQDQTCLTQELPPDALTTFTTLSWKGNPNQLSPDHVDWPIIDDVAEATNKPRTYGIYDTSVSDGDVETNRKLSLVRPIHELPALPTSISLRKIIRQRRSAVDLDGHTTISRDIFYKILEKTLARPGRFPFNVLPWEPTIHLALFVHRVEDLEPGLYTLVRDPAKKEVLQSAMKAEFAWEKSEGCPADLGLYRLVAGDARRLAKQSSCNQDIAADGCFSLGMIADFDEQLKRFGPWFYPRLFWESGMVGQVLYLEAEAAGIRGTGIGCFFDDPVHSVLGLRAMQYQSLYHFTMGGPIEDARLTTLPAYPAD